jgi:hypothetical protein
MIGKRYSILSMHYPSKIRQYKSIKNCSLGEPVLDAFIFIL